MCHMPIPLIGKTSSVTQTHLKKRRNTSAHSFNRSGACSSETAAGRSTIQAKNMPPTQITAASTWSE